MSADKRDLPECPKCGAPCTRTVLMRGGENGWSTTDEERAEYRYAHSRAQDSGEDADWMMELAREIKANAEDHPKDYISKFALLWADILAARAIATPPPKVEAQQGVVVDEAMIERACIAYHPEHWARAVESSRNITRAWMKDALTAALAHSPQEPTAT